MSSQKLKFRKNEEFTFVITARLAEYLELTDRLPNNTGLGYFRKLDLDSPPIFEESFKGTLDQALDRMHELSRDVDADHHAYLALDTRHLTYKQSVMPMKREMSKPESKIDRIAALMDEHAA